MEFLFNVMKGKWKVCLRSSSKRMPEITGDREVGLLGSKTKDGRFLPQGQNLQKEFFTPPLSLLFPEVQQRCTRHLSVSLGTLNRFLLRCIFLWEELLQAQYEWLSSCHMLVTEEMGRVSAKAFHVPTRAYMRPDVRGTWQFLAGASHHHAWTA